MLGQKEVIDWFAKHQFLVTANFLSTYYFVATCIFFIAGLIPKFFLDDSPLLSLLIDILGITFLVPLVLVLIIDMVVLIWIRFTSVTDKVRLRLLSLVHVRNVRYLSIILSIPTVLILAYKVFVDSSVEKSNSTKTTPSITKLPMDIANDISEQTLKQPKTWNELVDGKEWCNKEPLEVVQTRGVDELTARKFLSSLPHKNAHVKERMYDFNTSYAFQSLKYERELRTVEAENYHRKIGQYNYYDGTVTHNNRQIDYAVNHEVYEYVDRRDIDFIQKYDFDSLCPRVILFHKYDHPFPPSEGSMDRHRSFEFYEFHIYWFRSDSLFVDYFDSNT